MARQRQPSISFCLAALCTSLAASAVLAAENVDWSVDRGWLVARCGDASLLRSAPGWSVDVSIGGTSALAAQAVRPEAHRRRAGGFEVTYALAKGVIVDRFEPFPKMGADAWLRTLTYTNRSDSSQDLLNATMRIAPPVAKGGATWAPEDFWMGQATANRAVCCSYRGSTDHYHISVSAGPVVSHHVNACWRLAPGQSATIGQQGIWFGAAGAERFRREAQRWFSAIDVRVPENVPDWINDAILYEFNAGGHVDTRFSDVGGFDRLLRQADYLADLGVNAVWLQAPHQHKTPPNPVKGGWNLYGPRDFSKIDSILGGPAALKRLTDGLRSRGIHVLGEVVPHGGRSVQAVALKPWWTYGRDGKPRRNWGGCGMDYSSPEWQGVMRDAVAMLSRDFGMVGARIDVADGSGPNWRSPRTNHASFSTLGGALEMLRAIRDGLAEGAPNPVLIPESANTVEFFRLTPVGYGHAGWFLYGREIPRLIDRPAEMVQRLRAFYERQRGAYPRGARILRTLNNHDTVVHFGRVAYRYGVGLATALYGVCLMVPGIPMMYQEEEVGGFEARRRLNWARRRVPEFAGEEVDYFAVEFAPAVFTCLRGWGATCAIGLSNLSGARIDGAVRLAGRAKVRDGTQVFDAVSGACAVIKGGAFSWTLNPYETALIRVSKPPVGALPAERYQGEARVVPSERRPLSAQATDYGVRICAERLVADFRPGPGPWMRDDGTAKALRFTAPSGSMQLTWRTSMFDVAVTLSKPDGAQAPELTVYNADRWQVSGRTALLSDRVLRRHFPFPPQVHYVWDRTMSWGAGPHRGPYNHVAPIGRLWQSILEPLHPDRPALAFEDNEGTAIVLSNVTSTAKNIVLTDRTDEAEKEPYGLALRFCAVDPDISPRLATCGWEPWTMDRYPRATPASVSLRFTVSSMDARRARAALAATRLPVDRRKATVTKTGPRFSESQGAIWFIEPGTVTWSNLTPPVRGRYRIRLNLRHSEASADGIDLEDAYVIRVDDEAVPLEWVKHNVWQTGNAYFGFAMTPPLELPRRGRTISVTTRKTWCAMRGDFHLVATTNKQGTK